MATESRRACRARQGNTHRQVPQPYTQTLITDTQTLSDKEVRPPKLHVHATAIATHQTHANTQLECVLTCLIPTLSPLLTRAGSTACLPCKTCCANAVYAESCPESSKSDVVRCIVNPGYYGDGTSSSCSQCPSGTYSSTAGANDLSEIGKIRVVSPRVIHEFHQSDIVGRLSQQSDNAIPQPLDVRHAPCRRTQPACKLDKQIAP